MKRLLAVLAIGAAISLAVQPASADQTMCVAPTVGATPGPARIVVPTSGTVYRLDRGGCAYIASADVAYLLTRGYYTPQSQPSGTAGGVLAGTFPSPSFATSAAVSHQFVTGTGSGALLRAQPACADLSDAAASCSTDATNASNITAGTLPPARLNGLGALTNSLAADVALNNTSNYFDGPSVAQGTTGTWFASGSVTVRDTGGAAWFLCKLWDGTTVIASGDQKTSAAGEHNVVHLSGYLATPAGNIRISCKDTTATTGAILFNETGESKDATLSAFRIN